jgi:hypothetical protein
VLKYDGFRGIADTVNGRMLSKNRNDVKRFDALLPGLPGGCILDGEIVVLDDAGQSRFNALMFRCRAPLYVVFDVLCADGEDLRARPLWASSSYSGIDTTWSSWMALLVKAPGYFRRSASSTSRASWPNACPIRTRRIRNGSRFQTDRIRRRLAGRTCSGGNRGDVYLAAPDSR